MQFIDRTILKHEVSALKLIEQAVLFTVTKQHENTGNLQILHQASFISAKQP